MLHIKKTPDGCHITAVTKDDAPFISPIINAYEEFKQTYYYDTYVRASPDDINNDID